MIRIIGPDSKLSPADAEMLSLFFAEQNEKGINFWSSKNVYKLPEQQTGGLTAIQFKYDLVQRKRKEGRFGYRYEFIGNLFDKGGFASVFQSLGTLALEFPVCKINNRSRLIKHESIRNESTLDYLYREYRLALKGGLRAKEPVVVGNKHSYMVMKKMPGRSMFDLISEELDTLDASKRLLLCKNLLNAAKNQLAEHGIIHQDLAPENVIIDLSQETLPVTIIDFGLAFSMDDDGGRRGGKAAYIAPEAFDEHYTDRYDVYALGKLIAMIWNVIFNYEVNWNTHTREEILFNASIMQLDGLFEGIDGLTSLNKELITFFIQKMLAPNPEERISLDQACQFFETIEIAPVIVPTPSVAMSSCQC